MSQDEVFDLKEKMAFRLLQPTYTEEWVKRHFKGYISDEHPRGTIYMSLKFRVGLYESLEKDLVEMNAKRNQFIKNYNLSDRDS